MIFFCLIIEQSVEFVTMAQDAGSCTRFSHKVIHNTCGKIKDLLL